MLTNLDGDWRCPYCGASHKALASHGIATGPQVALCAEIDDGCGCLVVLTVRRIAVEFATLRVEGQGDWHVAPPTPAPEPEERSERLFERALNGNGHGAAASHAIATTAAASHDVAIDEPQTEGAPEPEPISESAAAILGAEHVVVSPLRESTKDVVDYRFEGFYDDIARMTSGQISFAALPRTKRVRLVELTGKQLARHLMAPPTLAEWDKLKPEWMITGVAALSYFDKSWKAQATAWHLEMKGRLA